MELKITLPKECISSISREKEKELISSEKMPFFLKAKCGRIIKEYIR